MNDYKFGNFLCQLREEKGMTQAQLAQMLNVTAAAVSKWENGESKPRIETLFALAQILGVSAEELMAGERKMQQAPVSEQEEQEQKQKLFLSQTENLLTVQVRLRRLLANLIDGLIAVIPYFILMAVIVFLSFKNNGQVAPGKSMIPALIGMPLMFLSIIALHLFRDVIAKGRSLGCRATGLIVLNENTGERAHAKQLILRNVLIMAGSVDDIVMLITGRSLGDRVAQTITVSRKQAEELQGYINEPTTSPPVFTDPKKNIKSVVLIVVLWCLLPVIFFVSLFAIIHHQMTTSEHYLVAQEYLYNSKAFQRAGADADDVSCISNSVNGNIDSADATLVFSVDGEHYTVICHKEGDTWKVCKDCTEFE